MISFPYPLRIPISNPRTGLAYAVVRGDAVAPEAARIAEVVGICNEPAVYEWLFRSLLGGRPYEARDAEGWFRWIAEGWAEGSHFCFLVVDEAGSICAACDIKSNAADGAEMGFWCSAGHSGIMTNAVRSILRAAREAGFRSLMACALRENGRSKALLSRVGFVPDLARCDASRDYFGISLG